MSLGITRIAAITALFLLHCSTAGAAEDPSAGAENNNWKIKAWTIQTSLYTKHWDPDPDHVNNQKLIGVEAIFRNDWMAGLALFDNSFGQPSQYLYIGKNWPIAGSQYWYAKLTGGLLHGYKDEYEDKIPFNNLGIAPAILPALGFRYRKVVAELQIAGLAAITVTAGVRF